MSGITASVFKATIGWLVDRGRDKAAEKLKDGDVTDQQFRDIILLEIDELKSKLDGLSRKDLLASISFFGEGIELVYDAFDETRPKSEYCTDTAQAACAEAVSLTENMQNLKLAESVITKLANAKERFKRARNKATDAFSNEALSTSDRILAMQYRLMATVLETIDNPAEAVTPCQVCIEELNSLPVVQQSFKVQFQTGILSAVMGLFNQEERRKVISGVCLINRVAHDVKRAICTKWNPLPDFPTVHTEKGKEVDLLRDRKVAEVLRKQDMEHCSVSWILGQGGEEKQLLMRPCGIAINSSGRYLVADADLSIKIFDNSGKFVRSFKLPTLFNNYFEELTPICTRYGLLLLATDKDDNLYMVLRELDLFLWVLKINETADPHHTFCLRTGNNKALYFGCLLKLLVSDSGKVMVVREDLLPYNTIDVYEADGQFVCSFGEQIFGKATDVTTVSDGRIMVVEGSHFHCAHMFSENGSHLSEFYLQGSYCDLKIVFHRESQQVVMASISAEGEFFFIQIYNLDGEFARSTVIHEKKIDRLEAIAVTTEGRVAVLPHFKDDTSKVIII